MRTSVALLVWSALAALLFGCTPESAADSSAEAIVDGMREAAFPEVMLLYNRRGGLCTATLISPRVVLTARHCVVDEREVVAPPSNIVFYVGSSERTLSSEYRARNIFIIPGSSGEIGGFFAYDIALVELTTAAREMPREIARTAPRALVGTEVTAVGFGQVPSGGSGTKYRATARVEHYESGLLYVDPTVCSGDSGGPMIGEDGLVYGVASFIFSPDRRTQPRCGTAPGAYNELHRHLDWIDGVLEMVGDLCVPDDGGEVCDGLDNDCDEQMDEGCSPLGSSCEDGSTCVFGLCGDTIAGRLCTAECDPTRPALGCAPGFYCGARGCSGYCVPGGAGDLPVGESCEADTDCSSLYCVDPGDGRRRCLAPCQLDHGLCLADEICVPQAGDACGGCIGERLVRGLGHGLGESCVIDSDCRSGMCGESAGISECVVACEEGACPTGFSCRDDACVRLRGGDVGSVCADNADCGMGICARLGERQWCTATCTDASTCPSGFECRAVAEGVSVCAPSLALLGEACNASSDCASALCSDHLCTQHCDSENSCGAGFECHRMPDDTALCGRPRVEAPGGCAITRRPHSMASAWFFVAATSGFILRRRHRRPRRVA